jgi:hypothetical protein
MKLLTPGLLIVRHQPADICGESLGDGGPNVDGQNLPMTAPGAGGTHKEYLEGLHKRCGDTLSRSLDERYSAQTGQSFALASDFDRWSDVLSGRAENTLFSRAAHEYLLSILSTAQGQYRNGFKSLRLVLELVLQGIYLSAHLVSLSEWLSNSRDTNWAALIDSETGALSKGFCNAFFSDIAEEVRPIQTIATTLYRELSECIHGNMPKYIPLPDELVFHESTFLLWHAKAETVRYVINFGLAMRYLLELTAGQRSRVESTVIDELGHIETVRIIFGGPRSS